MAEELSEEGDEVGAVGRTEMGKWSVQSACVCVFFVRIKHTIQLLLNCKYIVLYWLVVWNIFYFSTDWEQ